MSDCRICMAPIRWSVVGETGEKVPIDDHEQADSGPGRYRIVSDGLVPVLEAVAEESPLRTYVDHRELCQRPRAI